MWEKNIVQAVDYKPDTSEYAETNRLKLNDEFFVGSINIDTKSLPRED